MKKDNPSHYTESREVHPCQLRPGDLVDAPWGFAELAKCELSEDGLRYRMTLVPDAMGDVNWIERHIGNWPFVATGNKTTRDRCHVLRDGTRM